MKWKRRLKHSSCGPNYFSMGIWSVLSLALKAILLDGKKNPKQATKWNFCVLVPRWHGCNLFIALTSNKYVARPYKSTLFHVNARSHSWFKRQSVFLHVIYCNRPTPYVGYVWTHTDGRELGHTNLLISRRKDRWERNCLEIRNSCLYASN